MSSRRTFRICGRKLTLPKTPKLPDLKWDDLVQPSPIEKDFEFSRRFFKEELKGTARTMKKVVRRKRTKAVN
jgi:hypothetical protein